MRYLWILAAVLPTVAMAAEAPTPQEQLAQDKIQFGQLLIQLGQAELEISKLKKELTDSKPKPEAGPH